MKNLQKTIATGTLIGLSLIAGCKDSKKEQARVAEKSERKLVFEAYDVDSDGLYELAAFVVEEKGNRYFYDGHCFHKAYTKEEVRSTLPQCSELRFKEEK